MANNYKHSGDRLKVDSASGTITSGTLVAQEGLFGVAAVNATSGQSLWLHARGIYRIAVPAGVTKGDLLYAPGAPITESASAIVLTETATSNTLVGKAYTDRDADGFAEVILAGQA